MEINGWLPTVWRSGGLRDEEDDAAGRPLVRGFLTVRRGGDMTISYSVLGVLAAAFLAVAGPVWALSDADSGGEWIRAPTRQQIQVVNILSRTLGVDPAKLQQCLDKTFADPVNAGKAIRVAAQECKAQNP